MDGRRLAEPRNSERKIIGHAEAADFLWCMRIQVDTRPQCYQTLLNSRWREAFYLPLRLHEIQAEASLLFSLTSETPGPCPPPLVLRNENENVTWFQSFKHEERHVTCDQIMNYSGGIIVLETT